MPDFAEQFVPLDALSARQRRLVERHLPLVHLTFRRCAHLARRARPGRERGELLQEGCLALMDAVRTHDPTRHGPFAAFAMARIHFAMSTFAREQSSAIRVPFITQRRRLGRRRAEPSDRHHPDALPRVVHLGNARPTPNEESTRRRYAEGMAGRGDGGATLGDLVRECYDQALARAVSDMKHSPRSAPGADLVLEQCARERWEVPEPEARTPLRKLARALDCSLSRVAHCEERFRARVAKLLADDARYVELRRLARRCPDGLRHRPTPPELAALGGAKHAVVPARMGASGG
jgi:hypothetical protein